MKRWLRRLLLCVAAIAAVLSVSGIGLFVLGYSALGEGPSGQRLDRMQASAQYRDSGFENALPKYQATAAAMLKRWLAGGINTVPGEPIAVVSDTARGLSRPPKSALRITWLGHSSMLVEIDGARVLTDPVFSNRVSPWQFLGPRRFHPVPLALEDIPALDAVVLSHDHYDHLDEAAIIALTKRVPRFVVPLGIGAHLEYWGVPAANIIELDWWEQTKVAGLIVTATPARHFSGRSLWDANRTLWASWVIQGPKHRVYFSGDTAMFPQLADIGRRFGPFDATMIEVGAYSADWPDVHLGPEQAVQAHLQLRGAVMFPIHWGTFDLALHPWTEPVERTRRAAMAQSVTLVTPRPGQSIEPAFISAQIQWWPDLPWSTAQQMPIVSTGLTQ